MSKTIAMNKTLHCGLVADFNLGIESVLIAWRGREKSMEEVFQAKFTRMCALSSTAHSGQLN
jgi:hypothetical protein